MLDNEGTLNISGTLDVTQLGGLTDHGVTYTKGGSNGFKTSSAYSIKLVDNGGTLNTTATIKHGEIDNFVLGSDGVATAAGTTDYKTYFITAGLVEARTDSDVREEITAWYNAEKERISEKETYLDLHIDELSTELEAINTELQAIQSLIDDAVSSVFDWGSG